jgi:hypothetical protein
MFAHLSRARAAITATAVVAALGASAAMIAQPAIAAPHAPTSVTWTRLTLLHGWKNSPHGTSKAEVALVSGIVRFKGAIWTSGSNQYPFVLPPRFRPVSIVEVSNDLSGVNKGVLVFDSTGAVTVYAEKSIRPARHATSLDGVWFAKSASSFTALTPQNGWHTVAGEGQPAVGLISGIVHFWGIMQQTGGWNPVAFTLPPGFRPAANVYVTVDLCYANNGRLWIQPNGVVEVEAEGGRFSHAQCSTELDGASFAMTGASFRALTLRNGWKNAPYSTSNAAVRLNSGVVHFEGAISTLGSNPVAFTLPRGFRPATNVYIPVDLCSANYGRLWIQRNGVVTVQAEGGHFGHAKCFTSLDGASFAR